MNLKDQQDIIEAQRIGKQVMVWADNEPIALWIPVARGEHTFDFKNKRYKIEPRRVECFMALSDMSIRALADSHSSALAETLVSNDVTRLRVDGYKVVKITFLEP